MDKRKLFEQELGYIKNKDIWNFVWNVVEIIPDYFFLIPASSTGKYHPSYSLGEGGLYRHTRSAVRIAIELARLDWWHFTPDEIDLCIASLILHDGWKSGVVQQKFTLTNHPLIAVDQLLEYSKNHKLPISKKYFDIILSNISTHMGQWVFDGKTNQQVLQRPKTAMQKFTHMADYLASRKCLEMDFAVPIIRE